MRNVVLALVFMGLVSLAPGRGDAQNQQTLADIRQELTVLHVEMQKLGRELSTTGVPISSMAGASVLERVGAIEAELRRLTEQTEQLEHRIDRVVVDGTNRIGDLEFRLVELEGGDTSQLGQTTTLGGGKTPTTTPTSTSGQQTGTNTSTDGELAVGEQADFKTANKALGDGDYRRAADLFAHFEQAYPGSPLASQAHLSRGKALDGLGDTREAARAYLAGFTANATGPNAPNALFELGAALGRLGQKDQACVTLGEVGVRFAGSGAETNARQEMANLGCL